MRECPFALNQCEKFRQYGFGYCSVIYRTDADTAYFPYAVCDHRLDGEPVQKAVADYFGDKLESEIAIVPEVVLPSPRMSFDYIALERTGKRFIGVETQAIDLRGGGVGPAFRSILQGVPKEWRSHFTSEATEKGRGDTVAYGVNTANIYKRLGLQIAEKAAMLKIWGSALYVVTQQRPFDYLARRLDFKWTVDGPADITFFTFDYTGKIDQLGQMELVQTGTYRANVGDFAGALVKPTSSVSAVDFLKRVRKKARLD